MSTTYQQEQLVTHIRLELYNGDLPCGPRAIVARMRDLCVPAIPSERTIARILSRNGLTHARRGIYSGEETAVGS